MLDFRESWLGYPENAELVKDSETALLQQIQQSSELPYSTAACTAPCEMVEEIRDGCFGRGPES
jgi:hypothetical protein